MSSELLTCANEISSVSEVSSPGNEKIEQILEYGSIYAALKSEYLTGQEIISWLSTNSENCQTDDSDIFILGKITAYRAVCQYCSEEIQLENGLHFLEKKLKDIEIYQQIYILTHRNKSFYDKLVPILGSQALNILQGKVNHYLNNNLPEAMEL